MNQQVPYRYYGPDEQTLDVRDYVRPIWQRKWLIVAVTLIAIAGSYLIAKHQAAATPRTKEYVTSTEVYIEVADPVELINPTGINGAPNPPDGQQLSDIATLFTAQAITSAVYRQLHMPVGSAGSVSAELLTSGSAATYGTSIIVVQATSPSATLAGVLANTYVAQFLASRKQKEAAAAIADAHADRAQYDSLAGTSGNDAARRALLLQISQLDAVARNPDPGAYQISTAPPGSALPGPTHRPIIDALLGGLIGLLLSIGLAFALNLFDRRLLRVAAVEARYGRSVLAVLPRVSKPARPVRGRAVVPAPFVENLRSLRINLRLLSGTNPSRTLVVTSAVPGEGKSTVAGNLAMVCFQSGERVLLIDADLRRPSLATRFGIGPHLGLAHVLRGEASLGEAVMTLREPHVDQSGQNGTSAGTRSADPRAHGVLDVLTHGDLLDDPVSLLASRGMEATIDAAKRRYDLVIIDTAPLLAVADTVPMLSMADAVLLVSRLGVTTRDHAERLLEVLARVPDANIAGVVANDLRGPVLDGGYGGLYKGGRDGYGYGRINGNGNGYGRVNGNSNGTHATAVPHERLHH